MKNMIKTMMGLVAFVGLAVLPLTTWAALSNYHYAQLDLSVIGKEGGLVCATTSSTTPGGGFGVTSSSGSIKSGSTSLIAQSINIYAHAQVDEGGEFLGWFDNAEGSGSPTSKDNPYKCVITASSTSSGSPTTKSLYAKFKKAVTVFVAEVTVGGETHQYKDFNEAWKAAHLLSSETPATLKLLCNIHLTNTMETVTQPE